jgi:phage baseplate assembly protein W
LKDLKLIDGDLAFENGDFQVIEDKDEIQQCVGIVLGTNKGECFFNPELGIRFFNLVEKPTDEKIRNEILDGLSQEDRVDTLEDVQITRDKVKRKLNISFIANLTNGETIESVVTTRVG